MRRFLTAHAFVLSLLATVGIAFTSVARGNVASGLPIAGVLFAGPVVGLIVLPLMLYHQLQLMVCAALAQRLGRSVGDAAAVTTREEVRR